MHRSTTIAFATILGFGLVMGCRMPERSQQPQRTAILAPDAQFWEIFEGSDDSPGAGRHMRSEASASAASIEVLPVGAEVILLGKQGEWNHVRLFNETRQSQEGWIHASSLKPPETRDIYRSR
ncbi:MAG: SH3 domain-containing protein, partial [Myxococcota bacterium]|nr:SH3 domain-containing protein [Myxococcota bacterium]